MIPSPSLDIDTDSGTDSDLDADIVEATKSMYYSFDHVSPHSSLSLYQSAFNFMASSHDSTSHDLLAEGEADEGSKRSSSGAKYLSSAYASQELIKLQVNINEVNLDLKTNGRNIYYSVIIITILLFLLLLLLLQGIGYLS